MSTKSKTIALFIEDGRIDYAVDVTGKTIYEFLCSSFPSLKEELKQFEDLDEFQMYEKWNHLCFESRKPKFVQYPSCTCVDGIHFVRLNDK